MRSAPSSAPPPNWQRLPLLVPGMLALLAGLWGGLLRIPVNVPLPVDHANWITDHGALMVCGFLGTLIGLERAVGHGGTWGYAAPILTGAGALLDITGLSSSVVLPPYLAGSVVFTLTTAQTWHQHRHLFTALMFFGGLVWTIGNTLLLSGRPVAELVWWWAAFPGWIIIGERLELTRLVRMPEIAQPLLLLTMIAQVIGLGAALEDRQIGEPIIGVALILQSAWLIRFDIARRTVRQGGLTRFTAVCLLTGYCWLVVAGLSLLIESPLSYGGSYDAALHAYFLGFVFAMIFGHAPIIFPAVLNLPVRFANRFYLHVGVLQLSLFVRVLADLNGWMEARSWAAVFNATALVLFLANTAASILGRRDQMSKKPV